MLLDVVYVGIGVRRWWCRLVPMYVGVVYVDLDVRG